MEGVWQVMKMNGAVGNEVERVAGRGRARALLLTGGLLLVVGLSGVWACGDDSGESKAPACFDALDSSALDTAYKDSDLDDSVKLMGDLEPLADACPGMLWKAQTPFGDLRVIYVKGTHEQMGYQYGSLLGAEINQVWDLYSHHVEQATDGQITARTFGQFLDAAWSYLEPYLPAEYEAEINGMVQGAADAGVELEASTIQRFLALANVSDYDGEPQTAIQEIVGGYPPWPTDKGKVLAAYFRDHGLSCSFFSAWGSRTKDGHLLSSRVLDWDSDTGLKDYSLLTVYDPEGGQANVTFGYVGFMGALGGMNEAGVSVAEIGSTNTAQTLLGLPWTIRNRMILESASNLDDALSFVTNLEDYPNTVGYNFMLAWGDPEGLGQAAQAAAVETNALYSSVFRGSDGLEKEQDFFLVDQNGQGLCLRDSEGNLVVRDDMRIQEGETLSVTQNPDEYVHPGRPLSEAIFRGDDSFTEEIRVTQTAARGPGDKNHGNGEPDRGDGWMPDASSYQNRYLRYSCMMQAFEDGQGCRMDGEEYVSAGEQTALTMVEGLRMVRAAAMSVNVYMAVMDNTALQVAIAFESGSGDTWKRAADNDAIWFDFGGMLQRFRSLTK